MPDKFKNQTVIITGAGQGIGFEIAGNLASQGASILLNDIDPILCSQATTAITLAGGTCIGLPGDASEISFIQQMVDTAVHHFGHLTIAIANAGITLFGDFLTYDPAAFTKVMKLNLQGSFFLAQIAARQMAKQCKGGSILFMSSVTGHQAHKNLAAYGMSKAALEMLAKNLVIELSALGITVNCIAPGATLTERTVSETNYAETWARLTPIGKAATVADIANAVSFLISKEAKHITGQSLVIDGGWTAISPSPF
ncbi:MAG: SDR family oxidoreductase [Bacteroidota bacterium]